jgi:hypothetical protein
MARLARSIAAFFFTAIALPLSAAQVVAQTVLSAQPPEGVASPEGRLVIGRGQDYLPSAIDASTLFTQLEGSMKQRRDFAWGVVEQMLTPVELTLLDGVSTVEVPLWQTWYEGRSTTPANRELDELVALYFSNLKPVLDANPNADVKPVVDATLAEFSAKDLSASLTDENLSAVLHQLEDTAAAGSLVGQGTTMFSPSFVEHVLLQARGIDECGRTALADDPPPSPDQFSPCMDEFPRSAVMVKTSWRRLANGIPDHDTGAGAMTRVMEHGTWPGAGHLDQTAPIVNPDRNQIYTNISAEGTEWALTGIHFVTKDVREWVWVSLWWDPNAREDFGADRPAAIADFNGGVWANYKLCVNSSFAEKDPTPWASYTGPQASLGASIEAVYDAIQNEIDNGTSLSRDEFVNFFGGAPNPFTFPDGLGPWAAPNDGQTSWCSNPNVEIHPGNARTSCIGCHQMAFTMDERRGGAASFANAITGDIPQFARVRARDNFPAEFSWSFDFEFRPAISAGKNLAAFAWP